MFIPPISPSVNEPTGFTIFTYFSPPAGLYRQLVRQSMDLLVSPFCTGPYISNSAGSTSFAGDFAYPNSALSAISRIPIGSIGGFAHPNLGAPFSVAGPPQQFLWPS